MSYLVYLSVIFFAGFTHSTLQLPLSVMLKLFHASRLKHRLKTTRILLSAYLSGFVVALLLTAFAFCYIIATTIQASLESMLFVVLLIGLMLSAVLVWLFYYRSLSRRRQADSLNLWLPSISKRLLLRQASQARGQLDSFGLGMISFFFDLPFSVVLLTLAALSVLHLPAWQQFFALSGYSFLVALPLLIVSQRLYSGKRNFAALCQLRLRFQPFLHFFSVCAFLSLSLFIYVFRIF